MRAIYSDSYPVSLAVNTRYSWAALCPGWLQCSELVRRSMNWTCPAGLWRSEAAMDWKSIHPVRPVDQSWTMMICRLLIIPNPFCIRLTLRIAEYERLGAFCHAISLNRSCKTRTHVLLSNNIEDAPTYSSSSRIPPCPRIDIPFHSNVTIDEASQDEISKVSQYSRIPIRFGQETSDRRLLDCYFGCFRTTSEMGCL